MPLHFLFKNCLFYITFLGSISISLAQEFGYQEVQLTNNPSDNRYASYNKEGTKILFESNRTGKWQLYTMDINGGHQKQLLSNSFNDRRPTWHPYKNMILFESDRLGMTEIYKLNLDNYKVSKIPIPLAGNKSRAQFAPNGVEIVFNLEDPKGDFDIYSIHQKGKRPKKLIDDKYKNLYPQFSRRGNYFLYYSNKNNEKETNVIYTYNIITEERSRLTYFKNHSNYAKLSNNKLRVVYSASVDGGKPEIFIMKHDGKGKRQITFNDEVDILPSWSPKDINLLISRTNNGNLQIFKILLKEPIEP